MTRILHVVSPLAWVGEQMAAEATRVTSLRSESVLDASTHVSGQRSAPWTIKVHNGLSPLLDLDDCDDALWISPGLLIALNTWRQAVGKATIALGSPPADWSSRLSRSLLRRTLLVTTARQILGWRTMPAALGERPWSRIANGRVDEFPAARRDIETLQSALAEAPEDSHIELSSHVQDVTDEWSILVDNGVPVASSPYCVHRPAGSRTITTVFDVESPDPPHRDNTATLGGTRREWRDLFDERHREASIETAKRAVQAAGIDCASVLVAWCAHDRRPFILEIDPVWCSTPYPYRPLGNRTGAPTITNLGVFADAVISARLNHRSHLSNLLPEQPTVHPSDPVYIPDPWMVRSFSRRYLSYIPASSANIQTTFSISQHTSQTAHNRIQAPFQQHGITWTS